MGKIYAGKGNEPFEFRRVDAGNHGGHGVGHVFVVSQEAAGRQRLRPCLGSQPGRVRPARHRPFNDFRFGRTLLDFVPGDRRLDFHGLNFNDGDGARRQHTYGNAQAKSRVGALRAARDFNECERGAFTSRQKGFKQLLCTT